MNDISESREKLRSLLIQDDGQSYDPVADSFPRSKVMKFLMDPATRKLLLTAATAVGLSLVRIPAVRHVGTIAAAARAFTKSLSS
jgi:hypothetical protein